MNQLKSSKLVPSTSNSGIGVNGVAISYSLTDNNASETTASVTNSTNKLPNELTLKN